MNNFLADKIAAEYYRSLCRAIPTPPEVTYRAGAEAMSKILLPLLAKSLPAICLQMIYVETNGRHAEDIEKLFEDIRKCLELKHIPYSLKMRNKKNS